MDLSRGKIGWEIYCDVYTHAFLQVLSKRIYKHKQEVHLNLQVELWVVLDLVVGGA